MDTSTISFVIVLIIAFIIFYILCYYLAWFLRDALDGFSVLILRFYGPVFLLIFFTIFNMLNISNGKADRFYKSFSSKTLFWTDSYKREVAKDSAWAVYKKYSEQWDKLYSEQKRCGGYGTLKGDSLGLKMDSIQVLLDTAKAKYDRLPD